MLPRYDSHVKTAGFRPIGRQKGFPDDAMTISKRIDALGLTIPTPPEPLASYIPALTVPTEPPQLWIAGQVPLRDGAPVATGWLGESVDMDTAQVCARQCTLNALAAAAGELDGDLDRIDRVLKLACYVAATPDFTDHPRIANGASDLIADIFGDAGRHVRAAVGVSSLPLGVPVEIEFVFQMRG